MVNINFKILYIHFILFVKVLMLMLIAFVILSDISLSVSTQFVLFIHQQTKLC